MGRLKASEVRGIWAGVMMCWDEEYRFQEDLYAQNIERAISAQVHGIYTTGSTGEFYGLDEAVFRRMVDIQAELCGKAGMPLQIGCNSDATSKTIRLLEYTAGKAEVGAAQVNIPYWMELDDRELMQFFKDIYGACPDLPLVHYNVPRAKRFLNGPEYLKILDVAPSLIGVKYTMAGDNFGALQDSIRMTPDLSYFVAESLMVSAIQLGARGSYSSVIATNPKIMMDMYAATEAGRWEDAIEMQMRVAEFMYEMEAFIDGRGEGLSDPVSDKGLAVAAGCHIGHQRCLPPYIGWSDATISALRAWMKEHYPDFLFPE